MWDQVPKQLCFVQKKHNRWQIKASSRNRAKLSVRLLKCYFFSYRLLPFHSSARSWIIIVSYSHFVSIMRNSGWPFFSVLGSFIPRVHAFLIMSVLWMISKNDISWWNKWQTNKMPAQGQRPGLLIWRNLMGWDSAAERPYTWSSWCGKGHSLSEIQVHVYVFTKSKSF